MYSDVSLANASRWQQVCMMLHMVLMGYARLLLILGLALFAGLYALVMWLTGAAFLTVLPWAICVVLLVILNDYRKAMRHILAKAQKDAEYRYRLEEKYSELKTHPLLHNTIRREIGMPELDTDGVVLINGERFIPAVVEDVDLSKD